MGASKPRVHRYKKWEGPWGPHQGRELSHCLEELGCCAKQWAAVAACMLEVER